MIKRPGVRQRNAIVAQPETIEITLTVCASGVTLFVQMCRTIGRDS
jgi:hypothetical protein